MTSEERVADLEHRLEALEARLAGSRTPTEEIVPTRLYTAPEVARRLGCGLTNAYALMERGEVAVTRVGAGRTGDGKGLRVMGADLAAFLESRKTGGPKAVGTLRHFRR